MKVLKLLGWIFGSIGLAMLIIAAILVGNSQSFSEKATRAAGVVVELDPSYSSDGTTYAPIVRFLTTEEQEVVFRSSVSSSPPSYEVGEQVEVLYDPANPDDAVIDSVWQVYLAPMIVGFVGGVFFLIGGGMLGGLLIARRRRERLQAIGHRVTANVTDVYLNTSLEINGRNPYVITAQWDNPDTGRVHVFKSDSIWFDPSAYLAGGTIDVLIDPADPSKYHVDTAFLPEMA
jgi:hypothetical protein